MERLGSWLCVIRCDGSQIVAVTIPKRGLNRLALQSMTCTNTRHQDQIAILMNIFEYQFLVLSKHFTRTNFLWEEGGGGLQIPGWAKNVFVEIFPPKITENRLRAQEQISLGKV